MTAFAFSTHGFLSENLLLSLRWGNEYIQNPLRSPMSIFLSLGGDLKNARRDTGNE